MKLQVSLNLLLFQHGPHVPSKIPFCPNFVSISDPMFLGLMICSQIFLVSLSIMGGGLKSHRVFLRRKYPLLVSVSTILAMTFKQHIHKSSWYEPDCQLASIGPREFNATQLHMTQCFQSRAYSMWKMVYKFALESEPI